MKKFLMSIVIFFALFVLNAKESIDTVISKAAADIVEKCDVKSILAIDDFESPSKSMTLYGED